MLRQNAARSVDDVEGRAVYGIRRVSVERWQNGLSQYGHRTPLRRQSLTCRCTSTARIAPDQRVTRRDPRQLSAAERSRVVTQVPSRLQLVWERNRHDRTRSYSGRAASVTITVRDGVDTRYSFPREGLPAIVHVMVNNAFDALANPIRRGIVERLASGPSTVGAATSGFAVSKPAISRHLKVLEDAGVVERSVQGRTHQLRLKVATLNQAVDWLDRQRLVWDRMFDAVEDHLGVLNAGPLGARRDSDSNGGPR